MDFKKIHLLFILFMLSVSVYMSLEAQSCAGTNGGQSPWNWFVFGNSLLASRKGSPVQLTVKPFF